VAQCSIGIWLSWTLESTYGGHEHITAVGNSNTVDGGWTWPIQRVIQSIEDKSNTFYVLDAQTRKRAEVGVVRPTFGAAYLRTHADGYWNDNLLALPRC